MPVGIEIDGISFEDTALTARPDHAAVLGRIFTSWSLIESTIAGILGLLMHADSRAAVAVLRTFKTNSSRVDAVRKVGKEMLDPSAVSDFDDLMKRVLKYADERNKVAHNLWGVDVKRPDAVARLPMSQYSQFMVTATDGLKKSVEETVGELRAGIIYFTVADLEKIEQEGRDIHLAVMKSFTSLSYKRAQTSPNWSKSEKKPDTLESFPPNSSK